MVKTFAEREGLGRMAAGIGRDGINANRADFVRRHFHTDPRAANHYDLVIDTACFGLGGTMEMIRRALDRCGLTG